MLSCLVLDQAASWRQAASNRDPFRRPLPADRRGARPRGPSPGRRRGVGSLPGRPWDRSGERRPGRARQARGAALATPHWPGSTAFAWLSRMRERSSTSSEASSRGSTATDWPRRTSTPETTSHRCTLA